MCRRWARSRCCCCATRETACGNASRSPGRKTHTGTELSFGDGELTATVVGEVDDGNKLVQFHYKGIFLEVLERLGQMPLPPYIHEQLQDPERYRTVYSRANGSAAAPTAGLHFTKELLEKLQAQGVNLAYVTLHVGLGTFRPVKAEEITDHHMHSEFCMMSARKRRSFLTKRIKAATASSASAQRPAGQSNRSWSPTARSVKNPRGRRFSSTRATGSRRSTRSLRTSTCRRARSLCSSPRSQVAENILHAYQRGRAGKVPLFLFWRRNVHSLRRAHV